MSRGIYPVTVPSTTAPNSIPVLSSSARLCGWSLSDAGNKDPQKRGSTVVAAAAAGTLTMTSANSVAFWSVNPSAAWPAGVNQVTITNVSGGTQTYDIPGGTEQPILVQYIPPIGVAGGDPVVSVPAIVGGPAYTIDAEYTTPAAAPRSVDAAATVSDSGQTLGTVGVPAGFSDTEWLCDDGVYVGTNLTVTVLAGTISGVLYVRDLKDPDYAHD